VWGTQTLLGAAIDSWDRVREGACALLMAFPAPLPALKQPHQVMMVTAQIMFNVIHISTAVRS
jgi:hypothetical protein